MKRVNKHALRQIIFGHLLLVLLGIATHSIAPIMAVLGIDLIAIGVYSFNNQQKAEQVEE